MATDSHKVQLAHWGPRERLPVTTMEDSTPLPQLPPPELLLKIAAFVDVAVDLQNLRLVNRAFSKAATTVLQHGPSRIYLLPTRPSMDRFTKLTQNNLIAPKITQIAVLYRPPYASRIRSACQAIAEHYGIPQHTLNDIVSEYNDMCVGTTHATDVDAPLQEMNVVESGELERVLGEGIQKLTSLCSVSLRSDLDLPTESSHCLNMPHFLRHGLVDRDGGLAAEFDNSAEEFADLALGPNWCALLQAAENIETLHTTDVIAHGQSSLSYFIIRDGSIKLLTLAIHNFSYSVGWYLFQQGDLDSFLLRHKQSLKRLELYNIVGLNRRILAPPLSLQYIAPGLPQDPMPSLLALDNSLKVWRHELDKLVDLDVAIGIDFYEIREIAVTLDTWLDDSEIQAPAETSDVPVERIPGMAEAFGVAAGAFGVVSLSIQLAESVQKVKGFYANVRNAPPKLADLADEIGEMSDLIKELEQQHRPVGFVATPLMQRCIESSRKAVEYFAIFSSELEARVTTRRLRGGIRFALSQDEISRILSRMERAKTMLVLAYMQYQTASQQQQHDQLVLMVQSLASSQDAVLELVKPAVPNVNGPSTGAVSSAHRRKTTHARKIFRVRTPGWLSNTVWQIALIRSISGWEFTMHTYGVVADDAPILQAFGRGDIFEMQQMFEAGAASPFDRDANGWGLWEYGLLYPNIDILRFLLVYDVKPDPTMTTYGFFWRWALLDHSGDAGTLREDLIFLQEQYDEDQHASAEDRRYDEAAMRLARCLPGDVEHLRFWQTLQYWGWSDFCCPIFPRPFTDLLTRFDSDAMCGNTQLQLLAKSYGSVLAASMSRTRARSLKIKNDLEDLIVAAISMNMDIHADSNGKTLLELLLSSFISGWDYGKSISSTKSLRKALLAWLDILCRGGVELLEYGKEEARLFQICRLKPTTVSMYSGYHSASFNETGPKIEFAFQLKYGPRPSDWDVTLLDFVEECSGDFWHSVERSEKLLIRECVVPGEWIDS
ncbi:hypothetical protein MBLNU13_g07558t2 [Cladosporium sp. NU13]